MNTVQDRIAYLIQSIKNATDRHGRTLSSVFFALPSKTDYPDYYEIIQRPIDLKRIELRQYSTMSDLCNDLHLMFDNACVYNEPGSVIYRVSSRSRYKCVSRNGVLPLGRSRSAKGSDRKETRMDPSRTGGSQRAESRSRIAHLPLHPNLQPRGNALIPWNDPVTLDCLLL